MNVSKNLLRFLKLFYLDQRIKWHRKNYKQFPKKYFILDVGCGKGDFVSLSPNRIVGYDYNFSSLKIAKERNFPNLLCGDALKLAFKDESFENIYCADLIEHFNPREAVNILKELYRVLKKDGLLLICGPMPSYEFWEDTSHKRPYPPQSVVSLFIRNENKGCGSNPTLDSIGQASLIKLYWRYNPLLRQPWYLYTNDRRLYIKNLIRLSSILFFIGNILARLNILRFWKRAGYSILLKKV